MPRRFSLLLGLLLLFAAPVSAATYSWTDAQGQVYFSDRPPQEAGTLPLRKKDSADYSLSDRRARQALPILIYRDANLAVRLIRETPALLEFDVEYAAIYERYPDADRNPVHVMLAATSDAAMRARQPTFLGFRTGVIKAGSGRLTCRIYRTKRTPSPLQTDTLQIDLYQGDYPSRANAYALQRLITFDKLWDGPPPTD